MLERHISLEEARKIGTPIIPSEISELRDNMAVMFVFGTAVLRSHTSMPEGSIRDVTAKYIKLDQNGKLIDPSPYAVRIYWPGKDNPDSTFLDLFSPDTLTNARGFRVYFESPDGQIDIRVSSTGTWDANFQKHNSDTYQGVSIRFTNKVRGVVLEQGQIVYIPQMEMLSHLFRSFENYLKTRAFEENPEELLNAIWLESAENFSVLIKNRSGKEQEKIKTEVRARLDKGDGLYQISLFLSDNFGLPQLKEEAIRKLLTRDYKTKVKFPKLRVYFPSGITRDQEGNLTIEHDPKIHGLDELGDLSDEYVDKYEGIIKDYMSENAAGYEALANRLNHLLSSNKAGIELMFRIMNSTIED